jgi:hypothetical protein
MLTKNIMKIGIIEIMPKGHYTLVESLIQICCADPLNKVTIFTHKFGYNVLQPIINNSNKEVTVICKNEEEKLATFFKRINNFDLDKIYIVTLEKYFTNFITLKSTIPIFLFVHNIEDWFQLSLNILFYRFFFNFFRLKQFIFNVKVCFIYPFFKNKIKKKVLKSGGKFVVLNKILKEELSTFVNKEKIEVIPFSVFDTALKIPFNDNKILRICIPGILDNFRRDYFAVFKCIEDNFEIFKDKLELELLGGTNNESEKILKEADRLIKNGFKIIYHKLPYIPIPEYNDLLSKSDIILGNLNIVLNKYCIYGKTKDTGAIFVMIKFGKPGILPQSYALIDELKTSTLTYKTYDDLVSIFKKLISDRDFLRHISEEAVKNSLNFKPEKILNSL